MPNSIITIILSGGSFDKETYTVTYPPKPWIRLPRVVNPLYIATDGLPDRDYLTKVIMVVYDVYEKDRENVSLYRFSHTEAIP